MSNTTSPKKVGLLARAYAVLMVVTGALNLISFALLAAALAALLGTEPARALIGEQTTLALGLSALSLALALANSIGSIKLGAALFKSERRRTALLSKAVILITIAQVIVNIMLSGVGGHLLCSAIQLVILITLSVTIDPALKAERRQRRQLEYLKDAEAAAHGMEGRDASGKGFMELNFFNLFWEFTACSVLGLVLEIIWHMTVVDPGVYQDRAGLLFGPFSPIYGFGAVLITLALNRLYNKGIVIIFLVSAVVGGAFEVFVSLFMQFGFGAVAWDYSSYTILGAPDPIAVATGGRTSTMFVIMWGVLGLIWVKAFLPLLLHVVNLIPWKLRYGLTTVCAILMLVNCVMTIESLDCWFERESGAVPETAAGRFYAEYFDDEYMQHRFQSMTITPSDSTRLASQPAA